RSYFGRVKTSYFFLSIGHESLAQITILQDALNLGGHIVRIVTAKKQDIVVRFKQSLVLRTAGNFPRNDGPAGGHAFNNSSGIRFHEVRKINDGGMSVQRVHPMLKTSAADPPQS